MEIIVLSTQKDLEMSFLAQSGDEVEEIQEILAVKFI